MKKLCLHIILVAAIIFNSCSASMHTVAEQPAAPVYERSVSPGAEYIWIDGDWNWHNSKYVFSNGYWAKPKDNREWVNGSWVQTEKGYYWQKGYWK